MPRFDQGSPDSYDESGPIARRRAMLNQMGPDPQAAPEAPPPSASPDVPAPSAPPQSSGGLPPSPPPVQTEPAGRTMYAPPSSPTMQPGGGSFNEAGPQLPPMGPQNPYNVDFNTGIPQTAPPGQHWDNTIMGFVPNNIPTDPNNQYKFDTGANQLVGNTNPNARTGATGSGQRPTGGSLSDPGFAAQFVAWAATQPGVNPSVKNDPNYWIGRFTSGAFGNDQNYALARMMQAEGAPEGAQQQQGGGGQQQGMSLGGYQYTPQTGYQFGYNGGQLPPEIAAFYKAQTDAIGQQQAQQQQVQASMRDALLRMMAQGQEPVDVANDKTLGPAAAAYRNARQRGATQTREAVAERLAAEGLNSGGQGSGAFDSAVTGINQNASQDIAGYEAQLAQGEQQNRRQLLVQALQIANSLGARTEANDLQRELANMDSQLRYSQLGQQQGQFEDQMGFNYANLLSNQNRQNYLSLMG